MDREKLIRECLPLCRREALKWKHTPLDQDDLVGDAHVGLVKAAERFDPGRGVPFRAFALIAIRGALIDTVRRAAKKDSLGDGRFVSFFPYDVQRDDDNAERGQQGQPKHLEDPGPTLEELVERRAQIRMVHELPAAERFVLIRTTVDGAPAQEVADEMGVTPDRVYTLSAMGARRLKRRLERMAA